MNAPFRLLRRHAIVIGGVLIGSSVQAQNSAFDRFLANPAHTTCVTCHGSGAISAGPLIEAIDHGGTAESEAALARLTSQPNHAGCQSCHTASAAAHSEAETQATINPPAAGSVSVEEGLAAFARIYEVTIHPRCANCHVGDDNVPMWSGPSYGRTRPHGMNINADASRIGAETVLCSTCHRTSKDLNSDDHQPPHFGINWMLAPVEFEWFGKSPLEICEQLKDPARNGGRDFMGLAHHLVDDAAHHGPILWGWSPGGHREPAPYSLQAHLDDVLIWGVAGQPCPVQ